MRYKNSAYLSEASFLRLLKGIKIGIFGGSFNPPHLGHLHISNESVKRLNLDIVVWLITPLSPFKSNKKTLSLQERYNLCSKINNNNNNHHHNQQQQE